MKIKYLKLKNWLLLSVMSLFGLTACHCHKDAAKTPDPGKEKEKSGYDERQAIAMYGVPARDLKVEADDINEKPQPREPQVTVYGVPTVDFAVKGRVVDKDGKPVKGLQVMLVNSEIDTDNLPDTPHWKERMARMSDTTDAQGVFEVKTTDRPWEKVRVMVRDVDGDENGNYDRRLVEVAFGDPEPGDKPVSQWQLGEKKAEVTIEVERKE